MKIPADADQVAYHFCKAVKAVKHLSISLVISSSLGLSLDWSDFLLNSLCTLLQAALRGLSGTFTSSSSETLTAKYAMYIEETSLLL